MGNKQGSSHESAPENGVSNGLGDWLDSRTGYRALLHRALDEEVMGGARFAYVFGSVLTFLLVLQMVTGVLLAMYYSPSATDAWASVAYIQDQWSAGWFIRGMHSHGASAMVVVCALHLFQVALFGAYKKPRELNWIIGVLMMGVVLAFALTGYLLPWDQTGYWATQVATGIAGTSPLIGAQVQESLQAGNGYGNLTITRFFALHVFVLPALIISLTVLHIYLFRRHKLTAPWYLNEKELKARAQPFWPDQLFKDVVAMALVFAALVFINFQTHGASLDAPADPASAFDARPEWYFRALFQGLKYFHGTMEVVVALGAPLVAGGFLLAMPFLDRGSSRNPWHRKALLFPLLAGFLLVAALTYISFNEDKSNSEYQEATAISHQRAQKARELAQEYGVPPEGGLAVFSLEPGHKGAAIFARDCAGCHVGPDRRAPEIGPGYNSRSWIKAFLRAPSAPEFFGNTEIGPMKAAIETGAELNALVEAIYAESGPPDLDSELAANGRDIFEEGSCSNCHSFDWDVEDEAGPNLAKRGTIEMFREFIIKPEHPRWFGDDNEMPGSAGKYSDNELNDLALFLRRLQREPLPAALNPAP